MDNENKEVEEVAVETPEEVVAPVESTEDPTPEAPKAEVSEEEAPA